MRLAVIGNGGAGKSVLSGTLARLLARRGRQVLTIDLDPNPGLAFSLGMTPSDLGLPSEMIAKQAGGLYGWGLAPGVDPAGIIEECSLQAPDGVRYLSPGKIDRPDHEVSHSLGAVRLMADAAPRSWDVIGDLEAGTTSPYEGYTRFADRLLVLVTPSWKSALAARRLRALFPDVEQWVVASKFRGQADPPGLVPDFRVPFDPDVAEAERHGRAPIDACPTSPTVVAIDQLADALVREEATV